MSKREAFKQISIILFSSLAVIFLVLFTMTSVLGYYAYQQASIFSEHSGLSFSELRNLAEQAWEVTPKATNGKTNILILGLDTLETRGDVPPLTDTIILASLDNNTGEIDTLSLPRDLWSEPYLTKINALYYYGSERYPERPETFPEETLEEMIDVEIHHTIVLTMDSLSGMVDILGGIEVDVPVAFTDTKFPRPDVDVTTERDPEVLYKTISFEEGRQEMDGETVLEYVRSRHSSDDEGHDIARSNRQQLVINAIIAKLTSPSTIKNMAVMGDLYAFYSKTFDTYLPVLEAAALAKTLAPHYETLDLESHTLSIYPDDENGVVWHPPVTATENQWVYAIRDTGLMQLEARQKLQLSPMTASK